MSATDLTLIDPEFQKNVTVAEQRQNAFDDMLSAFIRAADYRATDVVLARHRGRPRKDSHQVYFEAVWGDNRVSLKTTDETLAVRRLKRLNNYLSVIARLKIDPTRLTVSEFLAGIIERWKFVEECRLRHEIGWPLKPARLARLDALLGHVEMKNLDDAMIARYAAVCFGAELKIGKLTKKLNRKRLSANTVALDTEYLRRLILEEGRKAGFYPFFKTHPREHNPYDFLDADEFYRLFVTIKFGGVWDRKKNGWATTVVGGVTVPITEKFCDPDALIRYVFFVGLSSTRDDRARKMSWFPWKDLPYIAFFTDHATMIHREGYGEDPRAGKPSHSSKAIPELAELLAIWRQQDEVLEKQLGRRIEHVIHDCEGNPLPRTPAATLKRAMKQAGIDKDRLCGHSLLHSNVTALVQAGVSLNFVSVTTSKSTRQIIETYNHFQPVADNELEAVVDIYGFSPARALAEVTQDNFFEIAKSELATPKPISPAMRELQNALEKATSQVESQQRVIADLKSRLAALGEMV